MKLAKICLAGICLIAVAGCGEHDTASKTAEPYYSNSYNSEIEIRMTAMAYGYYYAKAEAAGSAQRGIFDLTNSVPEDFMRVERQKQLRAK